MAMRPRVSGVTAVRPRPVMRPANENFKPKSEWKHEEGASVLSIYYLPGFVKEQINMQIDESTRLIRVQGQRPLPNARWIRFNEGFSIPENCDITKINSQLGSGILRITMPKIVTTQSSPKEEAKTTQEDQKDQEDSSPKPSSTTDVEKQRVDQNVKAQIPQKPASEPKPEKGPEVTPSKVVSTPSTEKQRAEQSVKALSPPKSTSQPNSQKGEEVTPSKATLTTGINEDKKSLEVLSPHKAEIKPKSQNGQDETPPKTISTTNNAREHKAENSIGSKSIGQITDEKKEKGEANGTPIVPKMPVKEKEKREKSAGDYEEKATEDSTTGELKEMEIVTASFMKALKGLAMGQNQERQLVVNIATAVLVIVGLGAYIFYSLGQ